MPLPPRFKIDFKVKWKIFHQFKMREFKMTDGFSAFHDKR